MTLVSNVHPVRRITISCIAAYSHFMRIVAYSLRQEFIRGTSKKKNLFVATGKCLVSLLSCWCRNSCQRLADDTIQLNFVPLIGLMKHQATKLSKLMEPINGHAKASLGGPKLLPCTEQSCLLWLWVASRMIAKGKPMFLQERTLFKLMLQITSDAVKINCNLAPYA